MSMHPEQGETAPVPAVAAVEKGNPPRKRPAPSIFNQKRKPIRRIGVSKSQKSAVTPQTAAISVDHSPKAAESVVDLTIAAFTDYPIIISKKAYDRGVHYHAFKFQSRPDKSGKPIVISPFDVGQFTRPVHLYRRSGNDRFEVAEQLEHNPGSDDKDRELLNARRAERAAEKEANQALIAPTGETHAKIVKRKKPQKKIEDQIWDDQDPKNQERKKLRYEEARPWHLEDFDGKNKWIGTYEAPLSKTSVMFAVTEAGFRMVPVEKWYRMAPASRVEKKLDADQIEKQMQQKYSLPRWWMGTQVQNIEARKQAYLTERTLHQSVKRKQESDEEEAVPVTREDYHPDVDEIDFEFNDEFQDDDEGFVFGDPQDDEAKDIEKRIREEMRGANLPGTGFRDEDRDYDAEEQQEKEAEMAEKKRQRKLRKQLQKKERRNEYESDSDDMYTSSSDEDELDEEKQRLEEEDKREEGSKSAQVNGDKSGTSTKGTNTPTGRLEKKPLSTLKRDVDLSEFSGNESSRKKVKVTNGKAFPPTRLGVNQGRASDGVKRLPSGYGSGSDTDASHPGPSVSNLRVRHGSSGSANASRSGTPIESRAQSPSRSGSAGPSNITSSVFPTLEEVRTAIPAEGIIIGDLVRSFRQRVGDRSREFIVLVKLAGKQDPVSRKIMPKQ